MANELDEMDTTNVLEEGREINVIAKQLPVKVGVGSKIFEVLLWILGIIPGIVFLIMKVKAKNYFQQLQQKMQHDASQIDNYLEQRVVILQNCSRLLDKAIDLDKSTFTQLAAYRSGNAIHNGASSSTDDGGDYVDKFNADAARNEYAQQIDAIGRKVSVAFENYPDLKAHNEIADAMQQNSYLQREITAARELYNDTINTWNRDIYAWPTKMIVAAKQGYTTRIPFVASKEIKEQAKAVFF